MLRPLTPQSAARIKWEDDVMRILCELLDCSRGDAQGLAEAQDDVLDACWQMGAAPAACAAIIDHAASPDPSEPAALNPSQLEAVAQADAHLNNAALPTYTQVLAGLRTLADSMQGGA